MPGPGTDMIGPEERLAHVKECMPEICSLDCGTLNFSDTDMIYISTPPSLRKMAGAGAGMGRKAGAGSVRLGHIRFAKAMVAEGLINAPPMFQLCLGIPWGADQTVETMAAMKAHLPDGASWAGFGISPQADADGWPPRWRWGVMCGSGWRIIMFLDRGVLATNGQLVTRAR